MREDAAYRPDIDGLRALSVAVVVLFHAGVAGFDGGYVGVDVFFVISGYLITRLVLREVDEGRFSLVRFYERRVRRLAPALYLVVLCSIPFAFAILLPSHLLEYAKSLVAIPTATANVLFWSERGYFGTTTDLKPMVHTWSLAVEEQFYLLYPLVLMAFGGRRRRFLGVFLVIAALLSLAASVVLARVHFETGFYLPFARAWELIAGALLAMATRRVDPGSTVSPWLRSIASAAGLGLIGYSTYAFGSGTPFPGSAALLPVTGSILVIAFASGSSFVRRLLAWRPLVVIGLMSYSIYLWHQPVFAFFRHLGMDETAPVIATLPLVVVLSWVSWRFVERPLRRIAWRRTAVFVLAGGVGAVIVLLGVIGVVGKGFPGRFAAEDRLILEQFSEYAAYNNARFDRLSLAPFGTAEAIRIVVVGDSYAKDVVNLVFESGLDGEVALSTKQINGECGNLYVDLDFEQHIPQQRLLRCRLLGWYESEALRERLAEADELWLVSSWLPWVVELLPQSVRRLENEFGVVVRVFGAKNFGAVSQSGALRVPPAERPNHVVPVDRDVAHLNRELGAAIPAANFVELLAPFCAGATSACRQFTPAGALVSPDGGHLTEEGARYLAPTFEAIVRGLWNDTGPGIAGTDGF